jgi:hypothetical protein
MSSDWQSVLEQAGARMGEAGAQDFGDAGAELAAARGGSLVAPLEHLGLIRVAGSDAVTLLQGQVTSDVREVGAERSQASGLCSPKGRLMASFRIVQEGSDLLLVLPRSLVTPILNRLRMFVLRADARLSDATGERVLLGLQGDPAAVAGSLPGLAELPGAVDEAMAGEGARAVRLPGGALPRFLILAEPAAAPALWEGALAAGARPAGRTAWTLTEVLAGVPDVQPETSEAFVPQMVNLQALGGVSFNKGCYAGQEVVARMQYLGKLKRRMYPARVQAPETPAPGTDLYAAGDASGQSAGKVVAAAPHPEGGQALLAVLQIDAAEGGPVHLGSREGPALDLKELPYPLEASA